MSPSPDDRASARRTRLRIAALVALLAGLLVAGHLGGASEWLERDRIRALVTGLGPLGVVAFVGLFALGELLHVPGVVFVAAAILAWGRLLGGAAAFAGALTSVTFAFVVVRTVGGKALERLEHPFFRRMLGHLGARPIRTVAALRALFWMAPGLNYALAMTHVRLIDYVIGSALGLALPIAAMALAFEWFFGN